MKTSILIATLMLFVNCLLLSDETEIQSRKRVGVAQEIALRRKTDWPESGLLTRLRFYRKRIHLSYFSNQNEWVLFTYRDLPGPEEWLEFGDGIGVKEIGGWDESIFCRAVEIMPRLRVVNLDGLFVTENALKCLQGKQYIYYISLVESKNVKGWLFPVLASLPALEKVDLQAVASLDDSDINMAAEQKWTQDEIVFFLDATNTSRKALRNWQTVAPSISIIAAQIGTGPGIQHHRTED